jgi:hypothetical protein
MTQRSRRQEVSTFEPQVGIFWWFNGELLMDSCPLSAAEAYGDCKNHPVSHVKHWAQLQREGVVPPETEYEEQPRGRIVYQAKTQQFTLLADRCILAKPKVVKEICARLCLPHDCKTETDDHYRCSRCMYGEMADHDEDGDDDQHIP